MMLMRTHCGPRSGSVAYSRDFGRMLDELLTPVAAWTQGTVPGGLSPRLDIHETDASVVVAVELPGLTEQEVDVELGPDRLTIKGRKLEVPPAEGTKRHVSERVFGEFERVISMPVEVDRANVQAVFQNGVLTVTLPKVVTTPTTTKVAVRTLN